MSAQIMSLEQLLPPIIQMLKTKNVRNQLAEKINKSVDIPMIGEQTEAKIIKKLIKMLVEVLEEMVLVDSDDE